MTTFSCKKLIFSSLFCALSSFNTSLFAQTPKPEFILALSHSVAKVHIKDQNGQHGIGSGAVVAVNHVATNCHVLANAQGIAVNKLGNSYAPIAMKADWQHDLCILIFDDLPLQPFSLGVSEKLAYEQHIVALGFSGNSPRPVESFGSVKALIPFDDSVLVRTNSGFRMGASGGALLDYEGNLVGLTTFKSPGRTGFFYSLPVEWVKKLLTKPDLALASQAEVPFWDAPEEKRPFFMRVVQPFQDENWATLKHIAKDWTHSEKNNVEAWFYLGLAEQGLNATNQAKVHFNHVLKLAPTHSSALYQLGLLAIKDNNVDEAKRVGHLLEVIDSDFAEDFYIEAGLKPKPTQ